MEEKAELRETIKRVVDEWQQIAALQGSPLTLGVYAVTLVNDLVHALEDHGSARDLAQATGGSCEDGPLGRNITLSETDGCYNAVVSADKPDGLYWTLIAQGGADTDQNLQGRIIANAINRGLTSHDEQAAKGVVPGGTQDRPTEGGEAVAWRWRQLHHEIDGPITGWSYAEANPSPPAAHRWEVQPLYTASPATPSGEIAGLREAADLWAELARHPQLSLQAEESDVEGDPLHWVVYREQGGRSDREWTRIAAGLTPLAAAKAALSQSPAAGEGKE